MSVTVTLELYSGRLNPSWELDNLQIRELADRIRNVTTTTLLKPPGIVGGLGYRGFRIQSVRVPDLDPHIYIHSGVIDLDRFDINRVEQTPEIEEWLLSTADGAVEHDERSFVVQQIKPQFAARTSSHLAPLVVPTFDPGKWNNDPNVRANNNCYNYANDKITNTFAQPGRGSGLIYIEYECGAVGAASERDGQISVPNPSTTPSQGHFIALVVWPGNDYHWYRLDANGMWSHKPGSTPARNTDNSGRVISDPKTCDRGPYTSFCGYYHCVPSQTRIN